MVSGQMLPKSWEEVHAIYISSVYVFYKTHREELSTVFISRKGLSTVFCVCFKLPQYCPGLAWSDMPFSSVSKASSRCQDIYLVLLLGIKDLCLSLLQSQRSERPTGFSTWICLSWIFCQTNFKTNIPRTSVLGDGNQHGGQFTSTAERPLFPISTYFQIH